MAAFDDARRRRALELLAELGEGSFAALLQDGGDALGGLVVDVVFGEIYQRPGLALRDRELAAVAALAALGREPQLDAHLRAAQAAGVTREELGEVIVQTAVFAGFPAALNAMRRLAALDADQAAAPDPSG